LRAKIGKTGRERREVKGVLGTLNEKTTLPSAKNVAPLNETPMQITKPLLRKANAGKPLGKFH